MRFISFSKDEEAEFRKQLKHMGKFSRKKFAQLAKMFHFRSKKKKREAKQLLNASTPSTMNLLDDDDDEGDEDEVGLFICLFPIATRQHPVNHELTRR